MSVFKAFIPLGDRLLVNPIKDEPRKDGIVLPDNLKPESTTPLQKGVIIAKSRMVTTLHQGDVIIFNSTAGFPVQIEGNYGTFRCIRSCNIEAIAEI